MCQGDQAVRWIVTVSLSAMSIQPAGGVSQGGMKGKHHKGGGKGGRGGGTPRSEGKGSAGPIILDKLLVPRIEVSKGLLYRLPSFNCITRVVCRAELRYKP